MYQGCIASFAQSVAKGEVALIGLQVQLLGRFCLHRGADAIHSVDAAKAQELFCYLLLHRERPLAREMLAELLWSDSPAAQARKSLRQALWQLQATLDTPDALLASRILLVDPAWVQINQSAALWLDVAVFEDAYSVVQGIPSGELSPQQIAQMQAAVELYQGDLLEGCYQDWCLYERERLQNMYLALLDKLMDSCEAHGAYETGITYGARILRYDRARERSHRQLMRLHYLAGNRTAALRQFERCAAALQEELGVQPARRTLLLYEEMRADQFHSPRMEHAAESTPSGTSTALPEVLGRLRQIRAVLADFQRQVDQDIQAVEIALNRPG